MVVLEKTLSVQFSSVPSLSRVRLCDPMNHSMPGFSVLCYHPEVAQTHVHWVGDAIQTYDPLSPPSPPALNFRQHQGLSQWVGSSHHVVKVLELQLQHQSFQWIFGFDFLQDWLVWSPCCPRDSVESFPAPQFKSINPRCSVFFMIQISYPYMTTGNTITLTRQTFVGKLMSLAF